MKSNKQCKHLSLMALVFLVLSGVVMAQEQPTPQLTIVMAREELAGKAKQAIKAQEPKWKLIQHELIGPNFYQTWRFRKQKVELMIVEGVSTKEATRHFKSSLVSSETIDSPLENLGDEAGYLSFWRSRSYSLSVRKGKVVFIIRAATLDLAKRFASHALTVDDAAMKAQN